jgi:hypothetical protein
MSAAMERGGGKELTLSQSRFIPAICRQEHPLKVIYGADTIAVTWKVLFNKSLQNGSKAQQPVNKIQIYTLIKYSYLAVDTNSVTSPSLSSKKSII